MIPCAPCGIFGIFGNGAESEVCLDKRDVKPVSDCFGDFCIEFVGIPHSVADMVGAQLNSWVFESIPGKEGSEADTVCAAAKSDFDVPDVLEEVF